MKIRTLPLGIALLVAGCASSVASTPTPSAEPPAASPTATASVAPAATPEPQLIGTVTIRADGCDLEPAAARFHMGRVALLVVNESGFRAAADLFFISLDAGGTFEDLARDTEEKHQKALRGETTGNHPAYLREIITKRLVADGEQLMTNGTANFANAGPVAIVCLREFEETGTINPLDTAGPLAFEEAP